MNEQLEELQRRIIEDIKENERCIAEDDLSPAEKAELRGGIGGMKTALFEISGLDMPYVGSKGNEN
ncbi:hypothetical protein [Liquorilactobacillus nagelii]|uniref:hypothetical protein n=1 Tax=Liquorilactobacillus nagelii TaxID=82688 RepID=UPI0006EFF902|nr:hypothetical protein [Liquorilactobacillus nagelii]KRL39897.1 hypothetical protein FD45_GL000073 [Liquorilactobacillus nagelii DSM 13675]QYH53416.1 hypothetical protein G6O73_01370 [Liquorilactobacillus nagelii DSM 13675]